jgi:hypothetical protein
MLSDDRKGYLIGFGTTDGKIRLLSVNLKSELRAEKRKGKQHSKILNR